MRAWIWIKALLSNRPMFALFVLPVGLLLWFFVIALVVAVLLEIWEQIDWMLA